MDSFNKTNLQNIKDIFEEKTGVALETRRRRQPIRAAMLVAAVLVCSLTMHGICCQPVFIVIRR